MITEARGRRETWSGRGKDGRTDDGLSVAQWRGPDDLSVSSVVVDDAVDQYLSSRMTANHRRPPASVSGVTVDRDRVHLVQWVMRWTQVSLALRLRGYSNNHNLPARQGQHLRNDFHYSSEFIIIIIYLPVKHECIQHQQRCERKTELTYITGRTSGSTEYSLLKWTQSCYL